MRNDRLLFWGRVCIAKQAIVVAGMLVVDANIHRYFTAAPFLNALAGVPS